MLKFSGFGRGKSFELDEASEFISSSTGFCWNSLLVTEPRGSLPIMANYHEMTLPTLPEFVQVMFVVAAKILLLWSIIAPTGSADNLPFTRTSLQILTSPFFQAKGLCFNFIRHAYTMG